MEDDVHWEPIGDAARQFDISVPTTPDCIIRTLELGVTRPQFVIQGARPRDK